MSNLTHLAAQKTSCMYNHAFRQPRLIYGSNATKFDLQFMERMTMKNRDVFEAFSVETETRPRCS